MDDSSVKSTNSANTKITRKTAMSSKNIDAATGPVSIEI